MTIPVNQKNPEKALASMRIGMHDLLLGNNDLLDLIVVAESAGSPKKDHADIADKSLKREMSVFSESEEAEEPTS
jgi:hypothetical protein